MVTQDYDPPIDGIGGPIVKSRSALHVIHNFDPSDDDVNAWLISKLRSEDVRDQPRCYGAAATCIAEARSRHTDYEYYDSGELWRVTRAGNAGAGGSSSEDDISANRVTTFDRDSYGNVFGVTERDASGHTRSATSVFDTRGIYPVSFTSLTHTTDVRYDERFGKLTVSLDPNDIARTWAFDDFGVLRDQTGPEGEHKVDYDLDQRSVEGFSAKYAVTRQVLGVPGTIERFNSLGQVVTRETSGLKGATVVESFAYGSHNLLRHRSRPHLLGDTTQGFVHLFYDEQDQVFAEAFPDGTAAFYDRALVTSLPTELQSLVPSVGGVISVVRSKDEKSNATYAFLDRDGRPVQVLDANNRATTYAYGAFGALRQITGPSGTLSYNYDNYGRLRSSVDAASGARQPLTMMGSMKSLRRMTRQIESPTSFTTS